MTVSYILEKDQHMNTVGSTLCMRRQKKHTF